MKYNRTYNFSAGPAMMPEPVLEEIRDEMMNYRGSGMCVMEMSHRSKVFQQIIDEGKGFKEEPDRVLTGGPMMGIAQYNLDVTCIKGTNAVLCLTKKEAAPVVEEEVCLRCGRCVNVCPMHLTPSTCTCTPRRACGRRPRRLTSWTALSAVPATTSAPPASTWSSPSV